MFVLRGLASNSRRKGARCLSCNASTTLVSAKIDGDRLSLSWADGHESLFHGAWLASNCRCPLCLHSTGQRIGRGGVDDLASVVPSGCSVDGANVTVHWSLNSTSSPACTGLHTSTFAADWLRRHCYSTNVLKQESTERRALNVGSASDIRLSPPVPELAYGDVIDDDAGLHLLLKGINDRGLALVKNVPLEDGIVGTLASRIAPLSHAIYGNVFDVRSEPAPINIAYTPRALPLHMDMAYYESPPGIQFLHCLRFDDTIEGGNSTFMDAHAVAEVLRERDPDAFATLCRVPATFQKLHSEREHPIRMKYSRPHITTNTAGDVTQVFWSPPFEGPLRVPEEDVIPYFSAYAAFENVLDCQEVWRSHGVRIRLGPGDLIMFNQRRMLHGRDAFKSEDGLRHLQGCYISIDDYLNRFRTLDAEFEKATADAGDYPFGERRSGVSSHF